MKKRTLFIGFLFISFLLLGSCSASDQGQFESGVPENETEIIASVDGVPERKIIYTVDLSVYTKDLEESIDTLKSSVNNDEWFDYEHIRETQASFKIRIKSDRLDEFVQSLDDSFEVSYYSKTGEDISLDYLDTTNRIAALEAQYDRLLELYENASLDEMIIINARLGEIETELLTLRGTLNTFDSLVDYSIVNITIYQTQVITKSPFFNRLFTSFGNGFNALIAFFDGLLMVLATILPFAIIFVPTGYGVFYLIKKRKRKKEINEPKS